MPMDKNGRNTLGHPSVSYQTLADSHKVLVDRARAIGATLVRYHTQYQDYWEIDIPGGIGKRTAYDVDIASSLATMERFSTLPERAHALDTLDLTDYTHAKGRRVQTTGKGTGTCAVCGDAGGVPCPKMLYRARDLGLVLKAAKATNIHPGRCRASLKKLIETGMAKRT